MPHSPTLSPCFHCHPEFDDPEPARDHRHEGSPYRNAGSNKPSSECDPYPSRDHRQEGSPNRQAETKKLNRAKVLILRRIKTAFKLFVIQSFCRSAYVLKVQGRKCL